MLFAQALKRDKKLQEMPQVLTAAVVLQESEPLQVVKDREGEILAKLPDACYAEPVMKQTKYGPRLRFQYHQSLGRTKEGRLEEGDKVLFWKFSDGSLNAGAWTLLSQVHRVRRQIAQAKKKITCSIAEEAMKKHFPRGFVKSGDSEGARIDKLRAMIFG